MTAIVTRGNAASLHLPDESVDLIVTSPPYFGLRSYQDGCPDCDATGKAKRPDSHARKVCPSCSQEGNRKTCNRCGVSMKWPPKEQMHLEVDCSTCSGSGKRHYTGQIGDEPTAADYLDAMLACTAEWVRVLKPGGSIFVNLGDKYATGATPGQQGATTLTGGRHKGVHDIPQRRLVEGAPQKSLVGLPWRYAIRCVDELGLILRSEIIWAKPNGLPESVTDRVRRSHEQVFHLTKAPRYFSSVDEIREETTGRQGLTYEERKAGLGRSYSPDSGHTSGGPGMASNPLGKLPPSVWEIPTVPLKVPVELGVDHFAAYPPELVRRIVLGWSPREVCTRCGEGRRPVTDGTPMVFRPSPTAAGREAPGTNRRSASGTQLAPATRSIVGYACACPDTSAPATPGVVLDPFGGTGTTALVASCYGRVGISVDLSADYVRLAQWRTADEGERARVLGVEKPAAQTRGQIDAFASLDLA